MPYPCKIAVLRAYQGLLQLGRSDVVAFENALEIFRFHHPETPMERARDIVADWIDSEAPTDGSAVN